MPRDPDAAFFGHPAGLSTLFFTGMWERLSYYGARAFLAIYMVTGVARGGRGMSDAAAGLVLALYLSSGYLLSLAGSWIADRFLGQRRAVTVGGIGIVVGNALLALPRDDMFYPGLLLISLGTGLLRPNITTITLQLYQRNDIRRDRGFTIYYLGINIGAFLAPLVGALLAQSDNFRAFLFDRGIEPNTCWKIAFAVLAVSMAVGLAHYLSGGRRLGEAGLRPTVPADPTRAARDVTLLIGVLGGGLGIVVLGFLLDATGALPVTMELVGDLFGIGLALVTIGHFARLARASDRDERKRVMAMLPLLIGAIAFFGAFEQASTTMSLFAERLVHRHWMGLDVPASTYQIVNAMFILLLAAPFAFVWLTLARRRKEPSSVTRFAIGMVLTAASFVVMLPTLDSVSSARPFLDAAREVPDALRVSPGFLVALYLLSTLAELCISPVGLSTLAKLAPPRLAGMTMGTWYLAGAIGSYLAGRATGFGESRGYPSLFYLVIFSSLVIAAGLFIVSPVIRRLIAGTDGVEHDHRHDADHAAPAQPATVRVRQRRAELSGKVDYAILTAIEVERKAVCSVLGLGDDDRVYSGTRVFWRGNVPRHGLTSYNVVVAQSPDMANIDMALLTSDTLHRWKPRAVVLSGIAASTRDDVRLGDVVVASEVYYYERGKQTPQGKRPEPKMHPPDPTLWNRVTSTREWRPALPVARPNGTTDAPRLHTGVVASGERVIADAAVRDEIASGHRKIYAIEMESYGFSRAVWQSFEGVRHLVVRGICDDGSASKDDAWHGYAAASAASFVFHFLLDQLGVERRAQEIAQRRPVGPWTYVVLLVLGSAVAWWFGGR